MYKENWLLVIACGVRCVMRRVATPFRSKCPFPIQIEIHLLRIPVLHPHPPNLQNIWIPIAVQLRPDVRLTPGENNNNNQ